VDAVVLVVEDDPDIREVLVELLIDAGYSVRAAANLAEARAFLARMLPSLLVADLNLPDGSSEELFATLAARDASIGVVVISAATDGREVAERHGAQYLAKPFCIEDLLSVTATLTNAKTAISAR